MAPSRREHTITFRATNDAKNQSTHPADEAIQPEQPEIQNPADVVIRVEMDQIMKQMDDRFKESHNEMNQWIQQNLRLLNKLTQKEEEGFKFRI